MTAAHAILFPFVGGDVVGGSHLSALRLIAALDPGRFRPRIVLHGGGGRLAGLIEDHGLSWDRLDHPGIIAPRYSREPGNVSLPRYLMASAGGLRRLLTDWGIDLVHTNDGRMHANWALPARLAGCRLVWHHRQSPTALGVNLIAPLLAHRIIGVSHFSRPARPVWPLRDRFRVIPSPFDLAAVRPDRHASVARIRTAIGAMPSAVVLGYVGVLNRRKRPDHFVRVIAQLHRDIPDRDIHGVILGRAERPDDPVIRNCIALAAELGIGSRLHLLGHRSPIEPWLAGLDALLVTALDEPFGRTLIEAMHLHVPVVATRHGGNPEAIQDGRTGFLVEARDPAAFVPPLRRLMEDPELRDRITETAARGQERFASDVHVRHVQDLYSDLLKPSAATRKKVRHV